MLMSRRTIRSGWQAGALVLAILTSACGAAEDPVLPTPRPTFTPSLLPTDTPSVVFNATATNTPAQFIFATSGPTPTPLLGFVPTRSHLLPPPTFIDYAPGSLQIEYFTTNATSVKPGDTLTIFWSAKGVDKAVIYRLDALGKRGQVWNVARAGSLDVDIRPDEKDSAQFLLTIGTQKSHLEQPLALPPKRPKRYSID